MTDFIEKSISKNAERKYPKIADLASFNGVITSFQDDITMNLAKKEAGAETYRATIDYLNSAGKKVAELTFSAADQTKFTAAKEALMGTAFVTTAAGTNATASNDESKDTWSKKYSCEKNDDPFTITIHRDRALVGSYSDDAILEAVENWADTVPALGGE